MRRRWDVDWVIMTILILGILVAGAGWLWAGMILMEAGR